MSRSRLLSRRASVDLYLQAVVAVEGSISVYAHPGFDAIATARARPRNDSQSGAIVGGSTIAQQLAKNQYFTQEQTSRAQIAAGSVYGADDGAALRSAPS